MNTRNKRSSAIQLPLPWRGMLPAPDGTVGQPDRQHVPFMYAGIAAGAPAVAVVTFTLYHGWLDTQGPDKATA